MKKSKKFLIYFLLSLFIAGFISAIYIYFGKKLDVFDNKFRDYLFEFRGEIATSENIVIVDIDEKSLSQVGQWPWSRNVLSNLLEIITNSNAGLIAFDIVFAEEDRTSPHKLLSKYNLENQDIENYDEIFAKTISSTPTILGYQFQLEDENFIKTEMPQIPAIFIEKNKKDDSKLLKAFGTILNTSILQNNSYSSGFFNTVPDELGVIRSSPLLITYDDIIYPSLGLEIIRLISDSKKVYVNYDENGISDISVGEFTIPTDEHGKMLINYRGKEKTFLYISATDILNNNFNSKEFEGKIVLIGTSAAGLFDLRATVFDNVFPGVEIHANLIDNILSGDVISKPSWLYGLNLISIIILSFLVVFLVSYLKLWLKPIIAITLILGTLYLNYYYLFYEHIILNLFFPLLTIILATSLTTLVDYFYTIKKEEMIKSKFASKVSKNVMEKLLENPDNSFQTIEKEITVFFSDIRGFTNISEQMKDAKNLIEFLNKYMEPMTNIITKNGGTVDKYIGDAIMAYWNAPVDIQNHPDMALKASIEQIKFLEKLNEELKEQNLPKIEIGIGLNTGIAVAGEMGSIQRSDYTVIGDPINLGSRLESLCKYYDSKINISNFTKEKLKENYIFRFLDLVQVKGKEEPVEIWQVIDTGEPNIELKVELEDYHQAINLYKNSKFNEALVIFEKLNTMKSKTNKNIYDIYINRCITYIKNPPENFKGLYTHDSKS